MDYITKKELNEYHQEQNDSKGDIEAYKYALARSLKGKMGEEMRNQLNAPPAPPKKMSIWGKIKRYISKRKEEKAYKKFFEQENEIAYKSIQVYLNQKKGIH